MKHTPTTPENAHDQTNRLAKTLASEESNRERAPFLRTAHNYDMNHASLNSGLTCLDKTLTQQQFLEETDINTIVRRFGLTGELPTDFREPLYGDYTGVWDYQTAMNAVRQADETFQSMPAQIRARFHNDPQELLVFLADEENRAEAIKLGLVKEAAEPAKEAPQAPQIDGAARPGATAPDPK